MLSAFGLWLRDRASQFGEVEQRMHLRATNARLQLALEAAEDLCPNPSERPERIEGAHETQGAPERD